MFTITFINEDYTQNLYQFTNSIPNTQVFDLIDF